MTPLEILDLMLTDMADADDLYRPTNFWQCGLSTIVNDLRTQGFSAFRTHSSATSFYVPIYADNSLRTLIRPLSLLLRPLRLLKRARRLEAILERLVDGRAHAELQYKIFRASLPSTHIPWADASEDLVGSGERFVLEGRHYSRSFLNYLLGLAFLQKNVGASNVRTVVEIGGGYGTLGEIFLKSYSDAFYIDIDIPPVAAIATYYLREVFGEDSVLTYERSRDLRQIGIDEIRKHYRCAVLCPWQLPSLTGEADLFVNYISFQEMEPWVVENYVRLVQPSIRSYVLLRNSKQGKRQAKKAGQAGVISPVKTDDLEKMFHQFSLVGRDSFIYGERSLDGTFESEVLCLKRSMWS